MDDETNQAHREDLREYGAHQCSACVLWSNKSKGNQSFEQTFLLLLRLLLLISLPPSTSSCLTQSCVSGDAHA